MINKLPKMALMLLALGLSPNATQAGDLSISNIQTETLQDSIKSESSFGDLVQISPYSTIYSGKSKDVITQDVSALRRMRLTNGGLTSSNDVNIHFSELNLPFTGKVGYTLSRIHHVKGFKVIERIGEDSYSPALNRDRKKTNGFSFNTPYVGDYSLNLSATNNYFSGDIYNKTFDFSVEGEDSKVDFSGFDIISDKLGGQLGLGDLLKIKFNNPKKAAVAGVWHIKRNGQSIPGKFGRHMYAISSELEFQIEESGDYEIVFSGTDKDDKSVVSSFLFDVPDTLNESPQEIANEADSTNDEAVFVDLRKDLTSTEEDSIASVSTVKTVNYYFNYDLKEDPAKAFTVENPEVLSNITLGESIKFVYKNYEKGSRESQLINFQHPEKSKSRLHINKLKDFEVKVDELGQYLIHFTRLEQGIVGGNIEFEVKNPSNDPSNNSNESDSTIVENPLSNLVENIEKLKEDSIKVNVNSDQDSGFTLKPFDTDNLHLGDKLLLEIDQVSENSTISWQVYIDGEFEGQFGHVLNKDGLEYKIEKAGAYEVFATQINREKTSVQVIDFEISEEVTQVIEEAEQNNPLLKLKDYDFSNLKVGDELKLEVETKLRNSTKISWTLRAVEQFSDVKNLPTIKAEGDSFKTNLTVSGEYMLMVYNDADNDYRNSAMKIISFSVEQDLTNENNQNLKIDIPNLSNLKVGDNLSFSILEKPENSTLTRWFLIYKNQNDYGQISKLENKDLFNIDLERSGDYTLVVQTQTSSLKHESRRISFTVRENSNIEFIESEEVTQVIEEAEQNNPLLKLKDYDFSNLKVGDELMLEVETKLRNSTKISWVLRAVEQYSDVKNLPTIKAEGDGFKTNLTVSGEYMLMVYNDADNDYRNSAMKIISFSVEQDLTNENNQNLKIDIPNLSNLKVGDNLSFSILEKPENSTLTRWSLIYKNENDYGQISKLENKDLFNIDLERSGDYTLVVQTQTSSLKHESRRISFTVRENSNIEFLESEISASTISPNPSEGIIQLNNVESLKLDGEFDLENGKVQLINNQGLVIDERSLNSEFKFDFSNHSPGLYNLRVLSWGGISSIQRFVIE